MGIDLETAVLLADERKRRTIGDRILTLGKQTTFFTLAQLCKRLGLAGPGPFVPERAALDRRQLDVLETFEANGTLVDSDPVAAAHGYVSADFFFRFLGFAHVASVDYSDYDGAQYLHDLNRPGLRDTVGTFDLVWDIGTMEHVFHVPNYLANIHDVLDIGGVVVHVVPANGMVDHGFFQVSPTLFYDYYHANGYADIRVAFCRESAGFTLSRPYFPHMLNEVMGGGLGGARYLSQCTAQKTAESTSDRIPQQRDYAGVWHATRTATPAA